MLCRVGCKLVQDQREALGSRCAEDEVGSIGENALTEALEHLRHQLLE